MNATTSLRAGGEEKENFFRLFCITGGLDMDPPYVAGRFLPAEKIFLLKSLSALKNKKS